jgi:hypothetical protein
MKQHNFKQHQSFSYAVAFFCMCTMLLMMFGAWIWSDKIKDAAFREEMRQIEVEKYLIMEELEKANKFKEWKIFLDTASTREINERIKQTKKERLKK